MSARGLRARSARGKHHQNSCAGRQAGFDTWECFVHLIPIIVTDKTFFCFVFCFDLILFCFVCFILKSAYSLLCILKLDPYFKFFFCFVFVCISAICQAKPVQRWLLPLNDSCTKYSGFVCFLLLLFFYSFILHSVTIKDN